MTDEASEPQGDATTDAGLHGAVIAGVIPDQSPRVLKEAARYAKLFQAPLVVVHVDVTRFVTYEDPDGYVHSAPIDINIAAGEGELAKVQEAAASVLGDSGAEWTVRQLVGDPAMAIKHFADQIDARLLVVGTRKRGFGESVREFFTGSVGARLAHRQHRPILIVPLGEPVPDDEEIWPA
ncbi:universal stress protein [Microbacterium trichothecenolyticum]|uniref:universal stress protein n=1 Tax=Microbacterium trichothecenolyticum TaxID=69370 RepID=UPI0035BE58B4